MRVFISWAGPLSLEIAEFFQEWLPRVIQVITPVMSTEIEKDTLWTPQLFSQMESSSTCISILTHENLDARWLLFEAGVMSSKICCFLVDVTPAEIKTPLSIYQLTKFEKKDVFRLIKLLNSKLKDTTEMPLEMERLKSVFNQNWPEFEEKITILIKESTQSRPHDPPPPHRSKRNILEEVLELSRKQIQRMENWEISNYEEYPSRNLSKICELFKSAKQEIFIFGFNGWAPIHEGNSQLIDLVINYNGKIKILIADPSSSYFEQRKQKENDSENRLFAEYTASLSEIHSTLEKIKTIDIAKIHNVELKQYSDCDIDISIQMIDNKALYVNQRPDKIGARGYQGKMFKVEKERLAQQLAFVYYSQLIEKIWNSPSTKKMRVPPLKE